MIYITGDMHGRFDRADAFCRRMGTRTQDILIVLGDACINFTSDEQDRRLKQRLAGIPVTFFCIHGNHENRPQNIQSYMKRTFRGGSVMYEPEYPNILFAEDGELFDLDGRKTIVIGGAYSLDKQYRLGNGLPWFEDEQPSAEIKRKTERVLEEQGWRVDTVLSHTVPSRYVPSEAFLKGIDQSAVDKSTEEWLGRIESRLTYQKWYAGHFHIEKKIDRLEIMYTNFDIFCHNVPVRYRLQD